MYAPLPDAFVGRSERSSLSASHQLHVMRPDRGSWRQHLSVHTSSSKIMCCLIEHHCLPCNYITCEKTLQSFDSSKCAHVLPIACVWTRDLCFNCDWQKWQASVCYWWSVTLRVNNVIPIWSNGVTVCCASVRVPRGIFIPHIYS